MESVTSAIISFFYPITFPNKLTNPEWYMRASLGIPDASLLPMAARSMKGGFRGAHKRDQKKAVSGM